MDHVLTVQSSFSSHRVFLILYTVFSIANNYFCEFSLYYVSIISGLR